MARFLRGDATPEEAARLSAQLNADPSLMDVMFAEAELERDLREVIGEFPAVVRRRRVWPILAAAAAAAALLAVTVGILAIRKPEPLAVAQLLRVEGRVLIVGEEGKRAGVTGEPLLEGEGVETPGTAKAVLSFPDGTRLSLGPGGAIHGIRNGEAGKQARLLKGAVTADVRKQPPGRSFVLSAPNAEARVVGTGFTLSVVPDGTRLEVTSGEVRLKRLSDGKTVDVSSGYFAVAATGLELVAKPLAPKLRRAAEIVARMAPNSWLSVPDSAMRSVTPERNQFARTHGILGPTAVILAWSGAALDPRRHQLVLWGGGHTDYHGNELYAFRIEDLTWERLTDPTPNPNLGHEANLDGTPNSRATYGGLAYLEHLDRFFGMAGGPAGGGSDPQIPWLFNFESERWEKRGLSGSAPRGGYNAACAYDPDARKVWWGDVSGFYAYDVDADRWTKHGDDDASACTLALDRKRGLLVGAGGGRVFAVDVRRGNFKPEKWKTTGGDALLNRSVPGFDYDPVRGVFVGWSGGPVLALDPDTKIWTAHDASGVPAPTLNGIFGRWRYVPGLDVFVVVTDIDANVHFYKPVR